MDALSGAQSSSVWLSVAHCGSDGEDHVTFSLGVFDMVRTAPSAFELGVRAIDKVNVVDVGSALSSAVLEVLELEGDDTPDDTTDSLTDIAKVLELDSPSACSSREVLELHLGISRSGVNWGVIDWNILWSSCDWLGCWHHVSAFRDTVVVHLLSCLFFLI